MQFFVGALTLPAPERLEQIGIGFTRYIGNLALSIAVSGLKMIQKVDLNKNKNLFVVSVILIAGIGGMVLNFGAVTITSVACALILGIITNLIFKDAKEE